MPCELPHLQNGCAHAFHDGRQFCLEIMIEKLVFAEIQMVEIQEYKKIIDFDKMTVVEIQEWSNY